MRIGRFARLPTMRPPYIFAIYCAPTGQSPCPNSTLRCRPSAPTGAPRVKLPYFRRRLIFSPSADAELGDRYRRSTNIRDFTRKMCARRRPTSRGQSQTTPNAWGDNASSPLGPREVTSPPSIRPVVPPVRTSSPDVATSPPPHSLPLSEFSYSGSVYPP